MRKQKTKRRTFRKALALLLVLLLTFGTTLTVTAASVSPVPRGGNDPDASSLDAPEHCEELSKLKIRDDNGPLENGTYTSGDFEVTVTFSVYDSDENEYNMVNWSLPEDSDYEVFHVFVKGGSDQSLDGGPSGGNLFSYSQGSTGDSGLFALNYQGISHVSFYYCEATPEEPEEDTASLTIIKELLDEDDLEIESSNLGFEVLINDSDEEEFWLGNISVDEGFSDDEMELGTYFIKENVDDEEFEVTYMMGETELTADEFGFIQVDLDEDGDSVTITVQNRPVADEEPDEDTASLAINKILLGEDGLEIESSNLGFEVVINDSDEEEFWSGNISVDSGFSNDEMELGTYFIRENLEEEDEFTVTYWVDGTELTTDEFGFIQVDLDEDGDSVTITVQNRPVGDTDEDDEEDDDDEIDDNDDEVDDNDDEDVVDNNDNDDSVDEQVDSVMETTVIEQPVPQASFAAEPVVDPIIVLDEPAVALGSPVLPQTGDSNPLQYSLAGLLLMAVGFIFRKRLTV